RLGVIGAAAAVGRRPGVAGAESLGRRAGPAEVAVVAAAALQLQRGAGRGRAVLADRDHVAGQARGGAVAAGHAAFVGEELHDVARGIDQGDGVVRSVLQAVGGPGHRRDARAAAAVHDAAGRHRLVAVDLRVAGRAAVVEVQAVAGQAFAAGGDHFHALAA